MPPKRSPSSRSRFLDLVAPKWRIPRCPNGNPHRVGICMGTRQLENFGRRNFYCDSKVGGAARCAYSKDQTWSPVLTEESRNRLKAALGVFSKALADDPLKVFESAAKCGMEAAGQQDKSTKITIDKESKKVLIFIYMAKNDGYLEHNGEITDGLYSFLLDVSLCDLINFPGSSWSIYDRFWEEFSPIPTYSKFKVLKDEFLLIRPSSFLDENCEGLGTLIRRLHALPLDGIQASGSGTVNEKRQRAVEEEGSGAGPSKRKKPNVKIQETEVLDWTNL